MSVPDDRRYTEEHEWALVDAEGAVRVGITDYAQDALGDVVFVDLPEVGASYEQGQTLAEVESTKSVAEIYAPVDGTVAAINEALIEAPEMVNQDPYGEGWFVLLQPRDAGQVDGLLDAGGYSAHIA